MSETCMVQTVRKVVLDAYMADINIAIQSPFYLYVAYWKCVETGEPCSPSDITLEDVLTYCRDVTYSKIVSFIRDMFRTASRSYPLFTNVTMFLVTVRDNERIVPVIVVAKNIPLSSIVTGRFTTILRQVMLDMLNLELVDIVETCPTLDDIKRFADLCERACLRARGGDHVLHM